MPQKLHLILKKIHWRNSVLFLIKTTITFKHPPETVRQKAKEGQFLPIKMGKNPVSFAAFSKGYQNNVKKKQAGIYIGVFVDAQNENWPDEETTKHIRSVHTYVKKLILGEKEKEKEKNKPGYAELYGAAVVGVAPIIYDPNDRKNFSKRIAKGQYERVSVPVNLNDIILLVNDYAPPEKKHGAFINTNEELKFALEKHLKNGEHKFSRAQYLKYLDDEIEARDKEIKKLDEDIVLRINNRTL